MYNKFSTPLLRQYAVIIAVNLVALCVGLDIGWSSPVLVKLQDPEQTPLSRPITEDEGGWIVSIGYIFSVFTLPCMGLLADCIGRKYSILAACLPKVIAGMMSIFTTDVWVLLVVRVINGITNTSNLMIVTMYSTEISSKEIRGSLGSLMPIFCNLGVLIMLGIGPYISFLNLSIMVTCINVCACIPLYFILDTPYSLYNKGKIEEAKKVLQFFRGSQTLAEEELKELSGTTPNEKFDKREIFRNKAYIKALIICVVMAIGVQVAGFNVIMFYLQSILDITNTSVSSALGSLIIGLIQVLASIFAGMVIDRFGRKPILISTLLAMAVGMIGLGTFFILKQHGILIGGFLNYLPLISIAVVTCSFGGGIGCLYFVVINEVFDGRTRAIGSAISGVISTSTIFLLTRYTMTILSTLGPDATFIVFGVICILMALFIIFFVPETKQKTIAEIQKALGGLEKDAVERKDYISRL